MDKTQLIATVKEILIGIDEIETESDDGWWGTSAGAEFGLDKLNELFAAIDDA